MVPGWNADYPEAGSFFGTIVTCASAKITSTNNVNRYCDPRLDEMIDSATKAERTDPAQALAQWTAVDKKTVDDAPLAPTVTGVQSMLVSRRLGNFQQTPLAGLLFGQMWVQ
jgi:ABC-type oligopeptide transport system substrate-binding subunit